MNNEPQKNEWLAATGKKYDNEKPRMDLLDPDFLEEVGHVLTFGARKYDAHNWRGGINYSRLIAAIYRHLGAINKGEDIDPESGRPHTGHLGCCVMFLDWMMKNRKDLDDRYNPVPFVNRNKPVTDICPTHNPIEVSIRGDSNSKLQPSVDGISVASWTGVMGKKGT